MVADDKYNIKVLDKTLNILECFTLEKNEWTINDLCKELKMSRNNIYRILATLNSRGYIVASKRKDTYKLGAPFVQLGSTVLNNMDLRNIASDHLKNLRNMTKETVNFSIYHNMHALIIDNYVSPQQVIVASNVGMLLVLHATAAGKILLSGLSNEELEEYISRGLACLTENTHTARNEIIDMVDKIRTEKIAYDFREETEDRTGVAAPVFNHQNELIASVGVIGPWMRFEENLESIATCAKDTAYAISKELGYRGSF